MPVKKTNKERVNITVDPAVHRKFAAAAEAQGMSVSGTLNNMMRLYVSLDSETPYVSNNPVTDRLRAVLGGNASKDDFRLGAGRVAEEAGFKALCIDDSDPQNIREVPKRSVDEWFYEKNTLRIGIKIVPELNSHHDLVLGQALMMRARLKCNAVHIIVPYITGINVDFLKTLKQVGLSILSIDNLATIIRDVSDLNRVYVTDSVNDQLLENIQHVSRPFVYADKISIESGKTSFDNVFEGQPLEKEKPPQEGHSQKPRRELKFRNSDKDKTKK